MGQRRKSRELAVQTLYALDFAEVGAEFREYDQLNKYPEILSQLAAAEKIENSAPVLDFADDLIKNAIINQEEIEAEIDRHSENWRLDNIALLDRSILHVAVYELMFTDTPPAVVINEAIEVSKKYCSEGSGKFLNGILDSVRKELLEKERIESGKPQ
ncbi:MAG: transcription antitermination factor NusB [Candidatus Syntrophosphaera sp.]|nr:transcription antitermination factor NusB [Candidatus Syntrophosphaera sp.]